MLYGHGRSKILFANWNFIGSLLLPSSFECHISDQLIKLVPRDPTSLASCFCLSVLLVNYTHYPYSFSLSICPFFPSFFLYSLFGRLGCSFFQPSTYLYLFFCYYCDYCLVTFNLSISLNLSRSTGIYLHHPLSICPFFLSFYILSSTSLDVWVDRCSILSIFHFAPIPSTYRLFYCRTYRHLIYLSLSLPY